MNTNHFAVNNFAK